MTTNLLHLASKVEAATPELQSKLIEEAWEAICAVDADFREFACAPVRGFDNNAGKFCMALEAMAFESAAIMLVPEGHVACVVNGDTSKTEPDFARASALVGLPGDTKFAPVHAATMALALCAASLRARAQET